MAKLLSPIGRPINSNTDVTSLGRFQPCCMKLFIHIFRPQSVAKYSFIKLSELRQCGENKIA